MQTGIVPETTRTAATRVKESFKQTDLWRTGAIFVNRRIANPRENVWGLDRAVIEQRYRYALLTGQSEEASLIDEPVVEGAGVQTVTRTIRLYDLGPNVLRAALQRLPFYQFSNLKRYLPHLSSINEFITSPDYLRRVAVDVYGAQGQAEALTQEQKLAIALDTLDKIGAAIEAGSADYIGTRVFEPLSIRYCVQDKTLQITVAPGGEQERGVAMSQTTNPELRLNLADQAWYVYDENYGTSEEKRLVRFIHGKMHELRTRFAEVYLIRNEKLFTLYSFDEGRATEPDFVLLAVERGAGKSVIYQVFIEPKGENLIAQDRWKQTFLQQIAAQHRVETLLESNRYRLLGLPFYNESLTKTQFETAFHQALLEN